MSRARTATMRLALCTCGIALCAASDGAVYVVDNRNPAASDANPCTESQPCKTISHALTRARAGDTVCVMEGLYDERVAFTQSGAEHRTLALVAVPKHAATIQGIETRGRSHLRIEGFTILPGDHTAVSLSGSDLELLDNRIRHARRTAIGVNGSPSDDYQKAVRIRMAYNRIEDTQFGMYISGRDCTIECNEVRKLKNYGTMGDSDYSRLFGENHVMRYNYFHGTERNDIGKAHVDAVQTYGVHDNYLRNATIEHNVFTDFHQGLMARAASTNAWRFGDIRFAHNLFVSRWAPWGLSAENMPRTRAKNNTFAFMISHGIGIRGSSDGSEAINNLFFEIAAPCWGCRASNNLAFGSRNKKSNPADPGFVSPSNHNFRLTAASPAVDAGVDKDDVGAFEYPNVWYVDPRHPAATDEGHGYAAVPFKTARHACEAASSGETVILRAGVYREAIAPKPGVAIRAMKGEQVVFCQADAIEGWQREGAAWVAPLAAVPKQLFKDGAEWRDFTYLPDRGQIQVAGFDPRLCVIEHMVRDRCIDSSAAGNVVGEGLPTVPVAGK